MPYTVKGKCVYKKDTGAKVGCTQGSVHKYLSALHTNVDESENQMTQHENPIDVVSMDIPFLIRVMEYSKEDAKTDMDLHAATEKMIALSKSGKKLTMDDYDSIFGGKEPTEMNENYKSLIKRLIRKI